MTEREATECYQTIVNKPDVYMFNAEVTGVMLELFSKVDLTKLNNYTA
jgi:hypothetical protein